MAIDSVGQVIIQYEDLRGQAVANRAGVRSLGYALFIRQGMAAWARVWRSYTIETPAPSSSDVVQNSMPLEMRTQVARVIAGIIFQLQRQETCSC